MPSLVLALKDDHSYIRKTAVKVIVKVAQAFPELAGDAMPSLVMALKDEHSYVR